MRKDQDEGKRLDETHVLITCVLQRFKRRAIEVQTGK